MKLDSVYSNLTIKTGAKMVLIVMDGVGDIATKQTSYPTPLEAAYTPHLDALSKDSAQGRMIPVAPGITPGSGPGHLGLFGYDPLEFEVGRGVIEALGSAYLPMGSQYRDAIAFVILILILTFRPSGLLGSTVGQKA